jgi:hypothetical protein
MRGVSGDTSPDYLNLFYAILILGNGKKDEEDKNWHTLCPIFL